MRNGFVKNLDKHLHCNCYNHIQFIIVKVFYLNKERLYLLYGTLYS